MTPAVTEVGGAVTEVGGAVTELLLPVTESQLPLTKVSYRGHKQKRLRNGLFGLKSANLTFKSPKNVSEPSTVTEVTAFLHNVELAHGLAHTRLFTHVNCIKIPNVLSTPERQLLQLLAPNVQVQLA